MLDIKLLRTELDFIVENLKQRGFDFPVEEFQSLEKKRKFLQTKTEELQSKRNTLSKDIGQLKAKGENAEPLLKKVASIRDELKQCEEELNLLQEKLKGLLLSIPNMLHESVPMGKSEEDNLEMRQWGEPRQFNFEPKDHVDLGVDKGWMDFETAVKIAGSRFVVLYGSLAKLHRALIQFMLDLHTKEHGYSEVYVTCRGVYRQTGINFFITEFSI